MRHIQARIATALLALCLLFAGAAWAKPAATPPGAAIASAHPLATAAGMEILQAGGNAFDAAVAVSAALAVVEPYSSGLGGGGFWLLHRARDHRSIVVDGRERAPLAATANMYQNAQGQLIPGASINGPLAAAIPGEPAALAHIAENYGRLSLAQDLAPAWRLAHDGFRPHWRMTQRIWRRQDVLKRYPAARELLLPWGIPRLPWLTFKQPDLANTLKALATHGAEGFYSGPVAHKLVQGVRAAGGIWTLQDLAQYHIVERAPIVFEYQGMTITSVPPPSSGGIVLAETLGILGKLAPSEPGSVTRIHNTVEAMRRAYRDRNADLGDPDFVTNPIAHLLSPDYLQLLAAGILPKQATPSASLPPAPKVTEGQHTTHFSVLDAHGNYVSATLSINLSFGSGFIAPGTGVVLNDEMDDFASKPGQPNAYGLVQGRANAIAPGKRPLSSMSPSFADNGERLLILGTPGGSRIITMVLLGLLDFADGADVAHIVALPRYHHQYLPDQIFFEADAFTHAQQQALQAMGYTLQQSPRLYGNMQAIIWNRKTGKLAAAADPRGIGSAAVALHANR